MAGLHVHLHFHPEHEPESVNFRHRRLTVYQLRATVNASGDLDNALHAVADLVLSYIAKYLYVKLPSEATEYRSFELDVKEDDVKAYRLKNAASGLPGSVLRQRITSAGSMMSP